VTDDGRKSPESDEAPPFLGSWRRIYAVVILNIAILLVLFFLFSRAFA